MVNRGRMTRRCGVTMGERILFAKAIHVKLAGWAVGVRYFGYMRTETSCIKATKALAYELMDLENLHPVIV